MIRFRRTLFLVQMAGTAGILLLRWWLDDALKNAHCGLRETLTAAVRSDLRAFRLGWQSVIQPPVDAIQWLAATPRRSSGWISNRPWTEMLTIRKGFIVGALIGFMLAESSLHAISAVGYWGGRPLEPISVLPPHDIGFPIRSEIPSELAWFFIQYPFISQNAKVQVKNHHTFIIQDGSRQKDYVVVVGQRFRRVEMYSLSDRNSAQVQVYTPGSKRSVTLTKGRVLFESTTSDGNFWMWRAPLWSPLHLKIYGMADLWLDSPYKKFSCAGFVHKFLQDAGVNTPILDAWDIAKQPWMRVPVDEMEPGDIITIRAATREHRRFWHHEITHVGVYIGYGKMIHAATAPKGKRSWVRIADVDEFHGRIDKVLRAPDLQ